MKPITAAAITLLLAIISAPTTRAQLNRTPAGAGDVTAPELPREFRGAWVSSVNNGTWPPEPGMTQAAQKEAAIKLLDRAVELKMNAIVFQVRPAADALYKSDIEPWSEYLSGTQGVDPGYDPLQFWIDESHRRGLQLHAWFNPYRAKHSQSKSAVAPNHVSRTHPEIVRKYGGYLWLDPGEPLAAQQSLAVFLDVVKRYDVDGIHMDDYFYPYQARDEKTKQIIDFPDDPSWQRYQRSGGKLSRPDWRRDNVNQFIRKLYEETKRLRPEVQVGVAPFGIWKPGYPEGIEGLNQYEALYADTKLWLNEGWLDYFSPQLYWKIEGKQSFPKLLNWWASENTRHRHLWPGMSVGRYIPRDGSLSMEVPNQLKIIRDSPGSDGFIFWPLGAVMRESALTRRLKEVEFVEPAIVPPTPWLDKDAPARPVARLNIGREDESVTVELIPGRNGSRRRSDAGDVRQWAVYAQASDGWHLHVFPGQSEKAPLSGPDLFDERPAAVVVSAIDRLGNESERVSLRVPPPQFPSRVKRKAMPATTTTSTSRP